eukprot:CAMPEP_0178382604 /NCGR_PEP_ID=MMETSP0689_2-20121128/6577_1 /TAXON_ID=160604 /ORGANISM="Amphidinium massartii, Strain CS-259" /LENGTH=396 /DNA_ID=CAMNT_0020002809 /DNA_START=1 /DNA_END=1191 /DNA_ORIENTATION=+
MEPQPTMTRAQTAQEMEFERQWFGQQAEHKDLRSYATSPPCRGMSNPPQSPKVRQDLLQHLNQVGVRHSSARPKWRMEGSVVASPRKVPYEFGSSASPVAEVRKRFTGQGQNCRPITKCGATQVPGAFWRAGAIKDLGRPLISREDADDSEAWFQQKLHYDLQLKSRNAVTPPAWSSSTALDVAGEPISPGSRGSPGASPGRKGPRSGQRDSSVQAMRQQMMITSMSDPEFWRYVHASKEGLLGQGRLHRAAVSDRFRFSADDIAGGGLVISGAGMAAQPPPGVWASDAAHLHRFHNSAMRIVAPSGLEPLSADDAKRRKKRGDDDDLQMSNSGLFKALYPVDGGLKAVRKLRKRYFPDADGHAKLATDSMGPAVTEEMWQFGRTFRSRSISGRYT